MKQTGVEWFFKQLTEVDYGCINKTFLQNNNSLAGHKLRELLEQAKAMEKEQKINFAEFVAKYPDKNININGEMLHAKSKYDGAERTIDLLKEYYESNT